VEISAQKQSLPVVKPNGTESHLTGGSKPKEEQQPVEIAEKQNPHKDLEKAVEELNRWIKQTDTTHLQFRLHDKLNEYYVEVVNDVTNEVIRQIPSKKILDLSAKMQEMIGLLIDEKR